MDFFNLFRRPQATPPSISSDDQALAAFLDQSHQLNVPPQTPNPSQLNPLSSQDVNLTSAYSSGVSSVPGTTIPHVSQVDTSYDTQMTEATSSTAASSASAQLSQNSLLSLGFPQSSSVRNVHLTIPYDSLLTLISSLHDIQQVTQPQTNPLPRMPLQPFNPFPILNVSITDT